MADLDQEFVEYVVRALVAKPEAVEVKRSIDERGVLLELTVDPEDMGKVIGRGGATAKSIRTLLRVLGLQNEARVNLKIVEPEGEREKGEAREAVEEVLADADAGAAEEDIQAQTRREIEELTDIDI